MVVAIALVALHAMLAMIAASILSKPWMRMFALGCAAFQTAMVVVLIFLVLPAIGWLQ